MTDLDLISIGAKHSTPGQFSREFTEEQWITAARAIESAATAPLLERIAELEAKLAQQASHVPEVHFGKTMKPETLRIELQKKCSAWGAYWRGADAHGVELTTDQAVELLENALNVEVEINDEESAQEADLQEPVGWVAPLPDVVDWRSYEPEVGTPLFTRPQPAQQPNLTQIANDHGRRVGNIWHFDDLALSIFASKAVQSALAAKNGAKLK